MVFQYENPNRATIRPRAQPHAEDGTQSVLRQKSFVPSGIVCIGQSDIVIDNDGNRAVAAG